MEGRRGVSRSERRRRGERGFITKPLPEKEEKKEHHAARLGLLKFTQNMWQAAGLIV